jgi:uncharacterized protein (TIGR02246 family)
MEDNSLRRLLIVSWVACLALTLTAQPTNLRESGVGENPVRQKSAKVNASEFRSLANEWKDAYNSKDAARLASLYAEDADYISSHVTGLIAHGREKIQTNFQAGMDAGGHIDEVRILRSSSSGDLAYLVCLYEATNSGQKVSGRNLIVSKKLRGKWLIVSHMTVVAG